MMITRVGDAPPELAVLIRMTSTIPARVIGRIGDLAGAGVRTRAGGAWSGGTGAGHAVAHELGAGGDAQLGEDLPEVVVDGARAEVQLRCDLLVGQALGDQPGDLQFLRGQLLDGGRVPLARGFSGGSQLSLGPASPGRRA